MEPGNEELQPAPPLVMQDHLDAMHTNGRSSDLSTSDVKPVLNYSIQTGEEFALEFMRDRVNLGKPGFPNAGDPSCASGYIKLKDILGISHAGSESGSDISMLSIVEKGPKEYDKKNLSLPEDRSNYGSIRSLPKSSFNQDNSRFVCGYTSFGGSDNSSNTMKILCSFGGRILPRPSDGKLRYVGGETRMIRLRKDISWQGLMHKTLSIYNQAHILKYQLPGEELDALVSVSSDEDLQNMMEECNHLDDREGSQKLRMFLFSMNDLEDAQFGLNGLSDDSEIQFVIAVNGMDLESRNNSTLLGMSSSANNLHELYRHNNDRETSGIAIGTVGTSNAPLTSKIVSSLTLQSSQPMPQTLSNGYETHPQFYGDQMVLHGETISQYPIHQDLNLSHNPAFREAPTTIPPHGMINLPRILNEGRLPSGLPVQNSKILAMPVADIGGTSVQQGSDPEKVLAMQTPSAVPSQPFYGCLKNNFPESTIAVTLQEGHMSSSPSAKQDSQQDSQESSSTASSAFVPAYVDSHSKPYDLSGIHPPPLPKRVYYSESTPRERVETLNRSSKSDDTQGSQFLVSDLISDINPQGSVAESGDNMHNGNLASRPEELNSAAKPLHADLHTVDNGFARPPMHVPSASGQSKFKLSEHVNPELKQVLPNNKSSKDVVNEDQFNKLEAESHFKDNHEGPLLDENKNSTLQQLPSVSRHDDPASKFPEINWGDTSTKETNDDCVTQALPVSSAENPAEDVYQDLPSNVVSKQAQGLLIDIDDRFPREWLSDMYSKAALAEDSSCLLPLTKDGISVSIAMENHEPKAWSYFHKLAQEGLDNVSLIDRDHLDFSPAPGNEAGNDKIHLITPVMTDRVSLHHVEPHPNLGEENQRELHGMIGAETAELQSNHGHQSQVKETESMQFDAMMGNIRAQESEFEDVSVEKQNSSPPPLDDPLGDVDISTLQVIKNEDLEELRELGSGTFGTVYHGKWRGTDVAIKRIKKSCFTGRSSEQERLTVEFWREADILSKLHHPNVVAFYGVVQDGPGGTMATVTEFMVDGSLRHVLLRKDRHLDRRKRLIIAMDAAFGMEYLHSKNIVHFDLKCDNLLVNMKDPLRPICKVGDFGLSKIKRNTLVSGGVRGTLPWMAPELLNGSSNKVSEKVDVFSFGIVLWEILTGEEPYANMHYGAIIGGIVNNTLRPTIPSYCDLEWRTLMEQCWAPNPAARPSFTEIASRLRVMLAAASQSKAQGHKAAK
ncbi:probable serine/threonine-protein kinase drkD [Neltuma alba]|uniref:probable serine/threonine-protein kinase drkD n=1 Tax=Neltuma alba TaxID=207710 RepID=UPI0010A533A8|nr:probable serine/threonine-protein kinase drkD [Prosopis alba]